MRLAASYMSRDGEVPEWSNGTVSKTVVRVTVPWVRIPPSPPQIKTLILQVCLPFRSCEFTRLFRAFVG